MPEDDKPPHTVRSKLSAYWEKREAETTSEPMGADTEATGNTRSGAFVVHLHSATRLHYDLRIEVGGALASFAVPKGISLNTEEKHLAIRTEDHPIEYLDFESVIPKGNYGAGPMICWDRGQVRYLETSAEEGIAKGKIDFVLSGYKLRGRFALVKTKSPSGKEIEWLLIKKTDAFSTAETDIRETHPRSVLSGLTVDELANASELAKNAEAKAKEWGAPEGDLDGSKVSPMLCLAQDIVPGDGYIYELKLDGVRLIADKRGPNVSLTYRSNRDTTAAYPEVERAVAALMPERVVLDGEVVTFDEKGVPNFQRLAQRIHLNEKWSVGRASLSVPVVYLVFDMLVLGTHDLRELPLLQRRELLKAIVPGTGIVRALDFMESVTGREVGQALLDFCRARQLEGIVAKRATSPYRAGPKRTEDWVKIKCERDESFVVLGYTVGKGTGREKLGALDLGAYEGDDLVCRGKVGSGLDDKTIDMLLERFKPLITKEKFFKGKLNDAPLGRTIVKPEIVVSIRYLGWSDDGSLRFPVFRGVDPDRSPRDCVAGPRSDAVHLPSLEAPRFRAEKSRREDAQKALGPNEEAPPTSAYRSSHPVKRAVLTNAKKIFWPKEGYTKGDLYGYYESLSTTLLPYLRDRPLVIVRYPDGIEGKNFFQWNVPWGFPAWVRHVPLDDADGGKKRVFLCNDLESLLTIVNLGAIPIHMLAWRIGEGTGWPTLASCDFSTIDFDVQRSTFANGRTLALELKTILDRIGLVGYPKTSGQSGLHVLIPLGPRVPFDTAQALNALLGRIVAARHQGIATMEHAKERRGEKVFVDIGQTGRKRTIVAPYSVRAHIGATVSTPLTWEELGAGVDPAAFTIKTVPERIAKIGDVMRPLLDATPDVATAVARLGEIVKEGIPSSR